MYGETEGGEAMFEEWQKILEIGRHKRAFNASTPSQIHGTGRSGDAS